jgi:N-carbamoyl-L-amino-acid hydrolase
VDLDVNAERCWEELQRLSEFSDVTAPAVQRIVFTERDLQAREYLTGLFKDAGLAVRQDPVGNLFARWDGAEAQLGPVATGSHTDAIPYSGRFDGTVGVLGGLEAIRALKRAGVRPRRSVELIMFTSEEPTRFGYGCLGSRLMSGQLSLQTAAKVTDGDGRTLDEVRLAAGCQGSLADVQLGRGAYAAFVERHIEQGPLLERAAVPIGVVTAIAAPSALRVRYSGPGGHAGSVLMADRSDPLVAAARLVVEVDAAARQSGSSDAVATVGVLDVHPRSVNSIPREVVLEIDVRDVDGPRRDRILDRIQRQAEIFGADCGAPTSVEVINADPPASCDAQVIQAIEKSANEAGLACQRMISRAYHDALFMSLLCPIGMVFIPCRDGVSHRPEEYASPTAVRDGVEVLARTLARLAA